MRRTRDLLSLVALGRVPFRVAWFQLRAQRLAARIGDTWSVLSGTPPRELAKLIELAGDHERVAEIGTGTAWTAISLALADRRRRVTSYDPVVREHRDRYLELVEPSTRSRLTFREEAGERASPAEERFGLVFIDGSHERDETKDGFMAWSSRLVPGGVVVFDDYEHADYPGVTEAIRDLSLEGERYGRLFIWRNG